MDASFWYAVSLPKTLDKVARELPYAGLFLFLYPIESTQSGGGEAPLSHRPTNPKSLRPIWSKKTADAIGQVSLWTIVGKPFPPKTRYARRKGSPRVARLMDFGSDGLAEMLFLLARTAISCNISRSCQHSPSHIRLREAGAGPVQHGWW